MEVTKGYNIFIALLLIIGMHWVIDLKIFIALLAVLF